MQLTMEQRIFVVKSYYETKIDNQVQTKFRTLLPERWPLNKTTIWKNVKKYERDDTPLNTNKWRSERRINAWTEENIEAVRRQWYVNDICQKFIVWVRLCGNGNML